MTKTHKVATHTKKPLKTQVCAFCGVKYKPPIFDREVKNCFSCGSISKILSGLMRAIKEFEKYSKQSRKYWTDKILKLL